MAQPSIAATGKRKSNSADISQISERVAELVAVTNSIISNSQGQCEVNDAFTKRLLAMEERFARLETQMRAACAAADTQFPAATGPMVGLIERAAQGQNVNKSVYLGDHLALAQVLDRFKMYVDTRDIGITPHLLLGGHWEIWITRLFSQLLRPGMTVVDVGANYGYYTLLAAAGNSPQGRVHAIEAAPQTFEILKRNVEVNGYDQIVTTHHCAALNVRQEVTLRQYRNHFGSNSIFSDPADPRIAQSVQVQGIPLDELISEPVHLMKIDAEGCEPLIFDGMQQLIARSPDIQILMEFAPQMISATVDPREFLTRIRRTGLKCQVVSHESKLENWPDERLLAPGIHSVYLSRA